MESVTLNFFLWLPLKNIFGIKLKYLIFIKLNVFPRKNIFWLQINLRLVILFRTTKYKTACCFALLCIILQSVYNVMRDALLNLLIYITHYMT